MRKEKKFQKVFKDPGQSRFFESVKIPVKVGDTILTGRFKNKKVVVKSLEWNEKGDLLINGRPALKFRVEPKPNIFDEFLIYTDMNKLINYVAKKVLEKTGISLEKEIKILK